jgi:hypothetical protein
VELAEAHTEASVCVLCIPERVGHGHTHTLRTVKYGADVSNQKMQDTASQHTSPATRAAGRGPPEPAACMPAWAAPAAAASVRGAAAIFAGVLSQAQLPQCGQMHQVAQLEVVQLPSAARGRSHVQTAQLLVVLQATQVRAAGWN